MANKSNNSALLMDIGQGLSLMLGLPRINYWDTPNRPQKPKRGVFGFNSETNSLEFFDGEHWLSGSLNKT